MDDDPIILSGFELLLQHTPDFTWLGSARTVPATVGKTAIATTT